MRPLSMISANRLINVNPATFMENLQVYRARFGGGTKLQIEADLHRGAIVQ